MKSKIGISSAPPKSGKKRKQNNVLDQVQVVYMKRAKSTNLLENSIRRTITNLPFGAKNNEIKEAVLGRKDEEEEQFGHLERKKTMKENFSQLVKSVPDLKFSNDIPVYKEAFPNLYDQEVKSVCLSKAAFDKI